MSRFLECIVSSAFCLIHTSPRQKWPCLTPPKNRKSPRVRSVHAEGALLSLWAPWLEKLVSCYPPPKKGQQKFTSKVFPNQSIKFSSQVFSQNKVNTFAPWNRYGPPDLGAPFSSATPLPPLSEILDTCLIKHRRLCNFICCESQDSLTQLVIGLNR